MSVLEDICKSIAGVESAVKVKELTQRAVNEGYQVKEIIDDGLVAGINLIGEKWKQGEVFIPEVLLSAELLRAGMDVISELIAKAGIKPIGKIVIGTVQGDVHDMGKSLVSMMMQSAGFEVHDLGVDVSTEKFVKAVKDQKPDLLGMSSLLTMTMPAMADTIEAIKKEGVKVRTIIGGAPTTQEYADSIGADGYAPDAISATGKAKELVGSARGN